MAISPRVLSVNTRRIGPGDPLHGPTLPELLPDGGAPGPEPLSWIRHGDGIVGWGEAARFDTTGPDRFTEADAWWRRLCGQMEVDDEVGLAGSGPVAFAGLSFGAEPTPSVVVVPRVVVGQRDGVRWVTTIGEANSDPVRPLRSPGTIRYSDGDFPATRYRHAVAEAVRRMRSGAGLSKVVLAHDLLATTTQPLDTRFLLRNLTRRYPSCWTFAVDGLVGATPEMLLERRGQQVRSRVLAGTIWPHNGAGAESLAAELLKSTKDRAEHSYAVESLAGGLRPFCSDMTVPEEPEVLRLRNVMHLTSDITGDLDESSARNGQAGLLRLLDAVHPTAAVGGTPTREAIRMIDELEEMDRGRYAGPVGWLDGNGNGEFGLALRCARVLRGEPDQGAQVRLFAGCGVVAESDPDTEVAEAEAKLLPIREALEGVF